MDFKERKNNESYIYSLILFNNRVTIVMPQIMIQKYTESLAV